MLQALPKTRAEVRQIVELPASLHEPLQKFLLDRGTGNVELNVKDGMILGMKITEIHRVRS